nr:hypothetical protein [Tanacetum cinerariifolium]GEZ20633.1 hypothetical protein [Tanacetum cinerariifolium]
MSFSKRPGKNTPQCYNKPLDSHKNWNNRFFWVGECVFPTVMDWRTNASKDGMPANEIDLFSLIRAPNPTKLKIGSRPRAPHEVLLLTLTAARVIEMDEPAAATDSSGVPSAVNKSPLDFMHEDGASDQGTTAPEVPPPEDVSATAAPEVGQYEGPVVAEPPVARESRKRGHDGIDASAPPKLLRRDHADLRPSGSSHGGKSLAAMQLCMAYNFFVSEEIKNLEALLETETGMKRAAEEKSARLSQELERMRAQFSKLQAAFEDYKRQQDQMVEQRCAEMDARLDALSIDFDEELYPHMLTAITGRMWVIGHGLRLAMMKCAESLEMRQAFADVVFTGLEGLKDAPMDVIMTALYLESDTEGMPYNLYATSALAPLTLPSSCTQRSDGVPVSVPTVVPQGLALLLVDAATQTDFEDA